MTEQNQAHGRDAYGWWARTPSGAVLHCGTEQVAIDLAAGAHAQHVAALQQMVNNNTNRTSQAVETDTRPPWTQAGGHDATP